MMPVGRILSLAGLTVVAAALAGCGSTSILLSRHAGGSRAVGQDGPAAAPSEVAVVRRWAAALESGDVQSAAGYFHLPSVFINGPGESVEIRNRHQAVVINSTLPCGARYISAFQDGRYVNVLFRLVARQGQGGGAAACGTGVGTTARTDFLIRGGQIVEWVRAPSRPGDPAAPKSGGGGGGPNTNTSPTTGTVPGQPVSRSSGQRNPAASAA